MSPAESGFIAVTTTEACPPGQMLCVRLAGRRILIANVDGTFYAVDELCSHEDASLAKGCLQAGAKVKCPLHGSRFDLASGQPLEDPATEPLQTYPVRVEQAQVWVQVM
jgi:3-phenylpropionate/trans-cinnamate dioxygenase ferredoxin subunit